jgi:trafficking protein particle complex subunit 6
LILLRLSSFRPPHGSVLDVLKFVCKDVWTAIWEKQVDNLRTNHRVSGFTASHWCAVKKVTAPVLMSTLSCVLHQGVYVLQDNHFKPLRRMSTAHGPQETAKQAKPVNISSPLPNRSTHRLTSALFPPQHLSFCCGIVRGALARLGVASTVTVDILLPPASSTSAAAPASGQQQGSAGGGASSGAQGQQGSSGAPVPPLAHVTACTFSVRIASGR